jgi:hypothetical protein
MHQRRTAAYTSQHQRVEQVEPTGVFMPKRSSIAGQREVQHVGVQPRDGAFGQHAAAARPASPASTRAKKGSVTDRIGIMGRDSIAAAAAQERRTALAMIRRPAEAAPMSDTLNTRQLEAVHHLSSTRVITHKIARLLQTGRAEPSSALRPSPSRTRRRRRCASGPAALVGSRAAKEPLVVSTFHSLGVRMLRHRWCSASA